MNAGTGLAVILSVLSAVGYAGGAVAQERLAARRPHGATAGRGKGFWWWIAVGGNAVGALLHVLALRYGALSVVQPLGALTLVFALPLGALALNRRVLRTQWWGAALTVAGLGVLLALVPAGGGAGLLGTAATYSLAAVVAAAVAALVWWARLTGRTVLGAALYGVAAGITFALASVLTQAVAVRWAGAGLAGLWGPEPVLLVAAALGGVVLSQAAYRHAGLAVPLTAVTLANPVAAALIGVLLLGEGFAGGGTGAVVALVAAAVAARGVLLLTGHDTLTGRDVPTGRDTRTGPDPVDGRKLPVGTAPSMGRRSAAVLPTGSATVLPTGSAVAAPTGSAVVLSTGSAVAAPGAVLVGARP